MAGSAPHIETYLLLEFPDSWGRDVMGSDLADELKTHIQEQLKQLPAAKFLFVRNPFKAHGSGPRFFFISTNPKHPVAYRFHLGEERDLLGLDLSTLTFGETGLRANMNISHLYRWDEPLYLVCTHGRRDACCAKFGIPIYSQLVELANESAWQCSHLGGHRFAPNLLVLPQGLLYGRLGSLDTQRIIDSSQRGEIVLDRLRGRTTYPAVVQAAEIKLRRHIGELGTGALVWEPSDVPQQDSVPVTFVDLKSQHRYRLDIRIEDNGESVFESCQSEKTKPVTRYLLDGIRSSPVSST